VNKIRDCLVEMKVDKVSAQRELRRMAEKRPWRWQSMMCCAGPEVVMEP
jgi:uncharacterized membrane protein YsdA (DUF1294 family)